MFGVTILGNNSALPAHERHPTSQVVNLGKYQFLIDCGEGAQMQMARFKIKRSRINHIFISHLHGDHYFGLPGLITSLGLLGRNTELHIYANAALKNILDSILQAADTRLPFTLHFHTLNKEGVLLDNPDFSVESFRVFHRIECWGFIFREKKVPRKVNKDAIAQFNINTEDFDRLKMGEDIRSVDGINISNELVTVTNTPPRSYAYCGDTLFEESIADKVRDVSLLYHETTYLKGLEEKAGERFHSTTHQAAEIAKMANVKRLLIGHFSSKYELLDEFLTETCEIFPETQLALEGCSFLVP